MAGTVFSLGSINADFQMRVDAAPGSAETLRAHHMLRLGGGKAANVAFLAQRLGHRAVLLGCVGSDDLAAQALRPLRDAGVALDGVHRVADCGTAVSVIMVPPDGKKRITLAENANIVWHDQAVALALAAIERAGPGDVLVADYEVPAEVVRQVVEAAAQRHVPVVIDPSFAERAEPRVLNQARAITPNAAEACTLTQGDGDDAAASIDAARKLASAGAAVVYVKLNDGGCVLAHGDVMRRIPSIPVEVVDSTGAGDAFTGALAVALLEHRNPEEAGLFAVAASSLAVTAYGSQPAYPTRAAIEAELPALAARMRAQPS